MIQNEYRYNTRFRAYVDDYCRRNGLTVEEALCQSEVRQAFWHYTEV